MRYGRLVCGSLLGVMATSTPAIAQQTRTVDFGFQGRVLVDSNVSRSSEAAVAARNVDREDVIYSPALSFNVVLPISRQSFYLRGAAGYDFHQKNDQLNSESFDVTSGLNGRLGPCSGSVSTSYYRGQANLQTVTLINSENAVETTTVGGGLACARSGGLGLTGNISKDWTSNSNAVLLQNDAETMNASVGVFYERPALGKLTVYTSYADTEYPDRKIAGVADGFESRTVGMSFERRISTRLQGVLSYGYTKVEPNVATPGGNFSGSTYGVDLIYRPTTRLRTQFVFNRQITPANGLGGLYTVANTWRVTGAYELGSRFALKAGAELADSNAEGVVPVGLPVLTDSESRAVFGAISFLQSERITWTLDARYEERDANTALFNYSRTLVGLTTNVAF